MKLVTFVAVVYNNYDDTVEFLQSLGSLTSGRVTTRCVVVDNSDDQGVSAGLDALVERFGFVQVLRPPNNVGYFGGFNYYFGQVTQLTSDAVVLCNNDVVIASNFVENLSTGQYPEDVFVVCPDVVTLDGRHQNPHVVRPRSRLQRLKLDLYFSSYFMASLLSGVRGFCSFSLGRNARAGSLQPQYLHMGIGACYVLLPAFLSRYDRLEYPHFLYGEEAYLSRQVHAAGGRLYFDPRLVVQHKDSATLSTLPKQKTYKFARDGYWSYRKFY